MHKTEKSKFMTEIANIKLNLTKNVTFEENTIEIY